MRSWAFESAPGDPRFDQLNAIISDILPLTDEPGFYVAGKMIVQMIARKIEGGYEVRFDVMVDRRDWSPGDTAECLRDAALYVEME